ncbi:MAG: hypothetical protein M1829_005840 [Trizodia sp. TS-e1964]|nr:MAG: hypothetical protein M1829_005840 [Trizodia sp. TS-e1964]
MNSVIRAPALYSSVYPERPIRPLPKRRLRSLLSDEEADLMLAAPPPISGHPPLFYYPYNFPSPAYSTEAQGTEAGSAAGSDAADADERARRLSLTENDEFDSDDDEGQSAALRAYQALESYAEPPGVLPPIAAYAQRGGEPGDAALMLARPQPPTAASTASSADGYDSFENSSNKKKRKIPTPGSASSHLSADMANMGISSSADADLLSNPDVGGGGVEQYYGSGHPAASPAAAAASGTGISGAGRGRYGRSNARASAVRSPLGLSWDGSNAWAGGRSIRPPQSYWPLGTRTASRKVEAADPGVDHGIISAAIASAAEKRNPQSVRGQENISLLQRDLHGKASPAKPQFTFTADSAEAANLVWPGKKLVPSFIGYAPASAPTAPPGVHHTKQPTRGFSTQGTQTSPNLSSQAGLRHSSAASQHPPNNTTPPAANQDTPQPLKKSRSRRTGKDYLIAARQRRSRQESNNNHHPPNTEDFWICEFCEYESIFGSPPEALMRQYEIKDRKERRRLAAKQRLLEKAKMKGRKNKKGTKAAVAAKAAANSASHNNQQTTAQQHQHVPNPPRGQSHKHGTESEGHEDESDPLAVHPSDTNTFPVVTDTKRPIHHHHHHPHAAPTRSAHADLRPREIGTTV